MILDNGYRARDITPITDCYWVGAVRKVSPFEDLRGVEGFGFGGLQGFGLSANAARAVPVRSSQ